MAKPPDYDALATIVDSVTDAVFTVDDQWRFTYLNRRASEALRAGGDELLGRNVWDVFPELQGGDFHVAYEQAVQEGRAVHVEAFVPSFDSWFEADAYPAADLLTVFFRECNDRIRNEWVQRLRLQITDAVQCSDGLVPALKQGLAVVLDATGYEYGEVWLQDRCAAAPRVVACLHGDTPELAEIARDSREVVLAADSLPMRALESGNVVQDHVGDEVSTGRRARVAAGLTSGLCLPIRLSGGMSAVLGVLTARGPGHDGWFPILADLHGHLEDLAVRLHADSELRRVFDLSRDLLCIAGLDGRLRRVNPEFCRVLGYDEQEVLRRPLRTFVHPEDLETMRAAMDALASGETAAAFENRFRTASGDYRLLSWQTRSVPDEGLMYGTARDVTDARRYERFALDQRELLRSIALGEPLGRTLDRLVRITEECLPGARASFVVRDRQSHTLHAAVAPSLPARFLDTVYPLAIGPGAGSCGTAAHTLQPVVIADVATDPRSEGFRDLCAESGVYAAWSVPFQDSDGEVVGVLTLYPDRARSPSDDELQIVQDAARLAGIALTRIRTEEELRKSEELFRILAGATTDSVWDWDIASGHVWRNGGLKTLFGHDPAMLVPNREAWCRLIHADDRARVLDSLDAALAGDASQWVQEYRLMHPDGAEWYVLDSGSIIRDGQGRAIRMIGGIVDLTERRKLEQYYLRAQRMDSIGTLAGGIAHDLNNALAPIMIAVDFLALKEWDDDTRELLEVIASSATHSSEMVRQVLSFARGADGERTSVDPAALIADLERIIDDSFMKSIQVRTHVAPGVAPITGDPTQLHQVLVNLAMNARDAMAGGGTLTATADSVWLDDAYAAMNPDAQAGHYTRISVIDTGEGIPPALRERIFEPFFTTKQPGAGTGLGLSTSLAIVEGHGGFMRVSSQPGAGTTFEIYLPAGEEKTTAVVEPAEPEVERGRGQLVMVVDDEEAIRTVTEKILRSFGYEVLPVPGGPEAVAALALRRGEIDAVIVDLVLPMMDGVATVRALRGIDPDVRIIASSGWAAQGKVSEAADAGASHFLAKPYTADRLLEAVHDVLNRPDDDRGWAGRTGSVVAPA